MSSAITLELWEALAKAWRESRRASRPFLREQFPGLTDGEYDQMHDRSVAQRIGIMLQ